MSGLLPREPPVDTASEEPLVVDIDDGEADALSVLSSEKARSILDRLYESPATKSELSDRVGTSIQNVDYHLDNLADAGLVEVVDQWYSVKGREMDVYAPTGEPLVLVAGTDEDVAEARRAAGGTRPRGAGTAVDD